MDVLKSRCSDFFCNLIYGLTYLLASLSLSGCIVPYLVKSSYEQQKILRQRVPIADVLKDTQVSEPIKNKLRLIGEAKAFAISDLHLKATENYSTYVDLHRPYVTWVLSASDKYRLEAYEWNYPVVGSLSYMGFFNEKDAQAEEKNFDANKYDTYVRGVTAYSTLGWFSDPVLSTMMPYDEYELVELIIHESTHATLYLKGQTDFNERLANFVGVWGAKKFYLKKEGSQSKTSQIMIDEEKDQNLFSNFISAELTALRKWYVENDKKIDETKKAARIREIQNKFALEIKPKMLTKSYLGFENLKLNNARLLGYETYFQDLTDFQKLLDHFNGDISQFLDQCRKLEGSKDPEKDLKEFLKLN